MSVFEQIDRINTAVVNQADLIEQIQNTLAHKVAPAPIRPVIKEKNINTNGTYTVPTGVDGFNPITVNVLNKYNTCTVHISMQVPNASYSLISAMTSNTGTDITPIAATHDGYGNCTISNVICGTLITIVLEGQLSGQFGGGVSDNMTITNTYFDENQFHYFVATMQTPLNANETGNVSFF